MSFNIVTVLRPRHLVSQNTSQRSFLLGGAMFEAPVENESGELPGNSGRTDSQVSVMIPYVVLPLIQSAELKEENARS